MAFSDSLRLLWMGNILKGTGTRSATTETFLSPRIVTVNAVAFTGEINLFVSNPKKSIAYYCHEADRFATAAFESLLTLTKHDAYPRSTAWLLIRGYYASFFALHSLMRIHGWACTRVGKNSLLSINADISALFPLMPQLSQGLYLLSCTAGGRDLKLRKLEGGQSGGSHEALWGLLEAYLNNASMIILGQSLSDQDAQMTDSAFDSFQQLVRSMGGPIWFTRTRNNINYAHLHGTWFPYKNSTCDYDRLVSVFERWKGAPTDIFQGIGNDELMKFAAACAFLVSLCKTTITDLSYRSPPNSTFRLSSGRLAAAASRG